MRNVCYALAVSHEYGMSVYYVSGREEASRVLASWALEWIRDVPEEVQTQIRDLIREDKLREAADLYFENKHDEFVEMEGPAFPPETTALDKFLEED